MARAPRDLRFFSLLRHRYAVARGEFSHHDNDDALCDVRLSADGFG